MLPSVAFLLLVFYGFLLYGLSSTIPSRKEHIKQRKEQRLNSNKQKYNTILSILPPPSEGVRGRKTFKTYKK
jgi:hypothetical protein